MNNRAQEADEIFISYSRKDKSFVEHLHDAIGSHGRNPWVDWDLEPLEGWEQSIRHAIDRAIVGPFPGLIPGGAQG